MPKLTQELKLVQLPKLNGTSLDNKPLTFCHQNQRASEDDELQMARWKHQQQEPQLILKLEIKGFSSLVVLKISTVPNNGLYIVTYNSLVIDTTHSLIKLPYSILQFKFTH